MNGGQCEILTKIVMATCVYLCVCWGMGGPSAMSYLAPKTESLLTNLSPNLFITLKKLKTRCRCSNIYRKVITEKPGPPESLLKFRSTIE